MINTHVSFFFFFQAEDGIRDFHVTGVQTCALPILMAPSAWFDHGRFGHKAFTRDRSYDVCSSEADGAISSGSQYDAGERNGAGLTAVRSRSWTFIRSEERRVGKECRSRGSGYH